MAARIFVDKMKRFSIKRRLDEDDFENDLEMLFPPINKVVVEVASPLSKSLIVIVNQQAKWRDKQPNKVRLHFKNFFISWL